MPRPAPLLAALLLLLAAPAQARAQDQVPTAPATGSSPVPPEPPAPLPLNVARLVLGVGFGSAGWGCHEAMSLYPYYQCTRWSYGAFIPGIVGLGADLSLGGPSFLGLGVNGMLGKVTFSNAGFSNASARLAVLEGYADYVHKFGDPDQRTRGRVRAGLAAYLGGGQAGGALRIGGGATFLNHRRLGVGLEVVVEGGVFAGYWASTLQVLVAPEWRF